MGDVDPEVSRFFKRQLASWKNALSRWERKCGGAIREQKEQTRKRPLVADRGGSGVSGFRDDETLSDATPFGYPSKSPADEGKDQQVEKQAGDCRKTLDRIRKTIELLNNARTTGRFPSIANIKISVRKQPRFVSAIDRDHSVSRGEVVEVFELKGDWLHIKTADVDGWIHRTELLPTLPIEKDLTVGITKGGERSDNEVEVGARDTVAF